MVTDVTKISMKTYESCTRNHFFGITYLRNVKTI